jgi:hypothetical protein
MRLQPGNMIVTLYRQGNLKLYLEKLHRVC